MPSNAVEQQNAAGIPRTGGTTASLKAYFGQVHALLWKDLLIEMRTKDVLVAMLVFGLLALTVFIFSFDLRAESLLLVSPGVLWVAILFAGTLGLGRAYSHERERGSMEGLLVVPMDRSAIFVAKFIANLAMITLASVVLLPVFAAFFDVLALRPAVLAIVLLGIIGFSAVGTVFGAMAVNTRAREVMLPVLLFPILVPMIIAAVKATGLLMDGRPWAEAATWTNILIGFDLIYLVVSFIVFEFVIEDWG